MLPDGSLTTLGLPLSEKPRPHVCEHCAKAFTQRHHLKRHKNQCHATTETKDGSSEKRDVKVRNSAIIVLTPPDSFHLQYEIM